jgi:phosphatidylglycerophosphate synthase
MELPLPPPVSPFSTPAGTWLALAAGLGAIAVVAPAVASGTALGPAAAAIAVATYAAVALVVARTIRRGHRAAAFGLPNTVTLARVLATALVVGYAAEVVTGLRPPVTLAAGFALLAGLAIAADGVDGWLARTRGPATPFGARFDMETDALLLLALSVLAFGLGKAGPWVIAIGALRYAFVAAGWIWPRLRAPLPPSFRRKAVCVVQGVALTALATPMVTGGAATGLAALALAALAWSFAVDIAWLIRTPTGHAIAPTAPADSLRPAAGERETSSP